MNNNNISFDYLLDSNLSIQTKRRLLREIITEDRLSELLFFICTTAKFTKPRCRRLLIRFLSASNLAQKVSIISTPSAVQLLFGERQGAAAPSLRQ